jgi:hypothetical protein
VSENEDFQEFDAVGEAAIALGVPQRRENMITQSNGIFPQLKKHLKFIVRDVAPTEVQKKKKKRS